MSLEAKVLVTEIRAIEGTGREAEDWKKSETVDPLIELHRNADRDWGRHIDTGEIGTQPPLMSFFRNEVLRRVCASLDFEVLFSET